MHALTREPSNVDRVGAAEGIQRLRAQRGHERVTFADVADHLVDYVERTPEARQVVDELAGFLAGVGDVAHDHDADPDRGLGAGPGAEPPAENPYGTTVPAADPTRQYESPLTRSGDGPYTETERVTEPGDPAIGGMD